MSLCFILKARALLPVCSLSPHPLTADQVVKGGTHLMQV